MGVDSSLPLREAGAAPSRVHDRTRDPHVRPVLADGACPRFSMTFGCSGSSKRGRGKTGRVVAPAVSCAQLRDSSGISSIQAQRRTLRPSPRTMRSLRYSITRLSLDGPGLSAIHHDRDVEQLARLLKTTLFCRRTTSVEASGPEHDFAVDAGPRARQWRIWRPPHLTATPETIARRPSIG